MTGIARAVGLAVVVTAVAAPGAAVGAPASSTVFQNPRLVDVRAAERPGVDRVVFEFSGRLPERRQVRFVPELIQDGSGERLPIAGRAILQVTMSFVDAHDLRGRPTAPKALVLPFKNVMAIKRAGDFEAVVTYGIGLARRTPVRVRTLTNPNRLVVDIGTRFPVVTRRVWFLNQPRFVAGTEPYVTAVTRRVPATSPAAGVLDRLFAGPTPTERGRGLRLVASKATGFSGVAISGGVARVRLAGGCSSGGSTFTIANEIDPAMRQFPGVIGVKILDPAGTTGTPGGTASSIPDCLNP